MTGFGTLRRHLMHFEKEYQDMAPGYGYQELSSKTGRLFSAIRQT
jgi:hypothetical protein